MEAGTFTVDGKSGPWEYVNGGLNTAFQYGVDDQSPPTIVSSVSGIDIVPGLPWSRSMNPELSVGGQAPLFGAGGDPSKPNPDLPPHSNGPYPSFYMSFSPSQPINAYELVGTFANSQGQIVGTPFPVGEGPTVLTVPLGATQLQLGVNDNCSQITLAHGP